MMTNTNKGLKSCLIISYGPVPTPNYQKIEGGGMRAWGLAKGLLSHGINVTVAINNSFPQELGVHEKIKLVNWSLDEEFIKLINSFDTVIISYCMGDPSVFVVDNISPKVQLLLDVYVPIYVEVSARDTQDMPGEYSAYAHDIANHNKVLKRGDYFLCANNVQKIFYTGVLGSLGVVNPLSYRQERIKVVPFGIHSESQSITEDPFASLGISKKYKRVLWFGGLYPWFRIEEILNAVKTLAQKDKDFTFVLVGGKNPFNNNPDLLRQYETATKFASEHGLLNKQMFFVDWVDFDKRVNWYHHSDFVISINQPGEENIFAWRTRVMDYIWGDIVPMTNGGDPLGDELISSGAAIKLNTLDSKGIVKAIESIYTKKSTLSNAKKALSEVKEKYLWENITDSVAYLINTHELKYHYEQNFILTNDIDVNLGSNSVSNQSQKPHRKFAKHVQRSKKIASYARRKGLKRSARLGASIVKNQLVRKTINPRKFVFISHPIDHTGAPLVLLHIIDEVIEKFGARNIRILAPSVDKDILKKLRHKGVKVEKAAEMSYRLAAAQLALSRDDFVFMNTVAVYDCYREVILNMLNLGRLTQAHWFIHEDEEQLKVVKGVIKEDDLREKIGRLLNDNRLSIYVPALRVKSYYDKLFVTKNVKVVPLQLDVPKNLQKKRTLKDFKKINFLITGASSDGRKGQLIVLSALQTYLLKYRSKNPSNYRDLSVYFISVGDDYVSSQVKSIGHAILGKKLHTYPALPRKEALSIANSCNAVICSSLNETFGLYIAEGMLMGHIVLRNDSAGREEQLAEGKNGYYIDSNDINQMADVFEKILNKKSTPNKALLSMSKTSQQMMEPYTNNKYISKFTIGE